MRFVMRSNPARNPFFIKIFAYRRGGRLSTPHVQTVTSPMSKLVKPIIFQIARMKTSNLRCAHTVPVKPEIIENFEFIFSRIIYFEMSRNLKYIKYNIKYK